MKIDAFDLDQRVLLVAEIGNNHEGDVDRAEEMIRLAAEAGAGAVKLQIFRTELYVRREDEARFARLKSFELNRAAVARLKAAADRAGVLFLATPFDLESARMLDAFVPAFKIASGDNTFYPLLETVAGYGKPVLLSCGLASVGRLRYAKALVERVWEERGLAGELAALHCVTGYPVPPQQANLGVIPKLAAALDCTVGYSDHTLGIEACVLAVAMGARVIEKHFTLDKGLSDFQDHQLSADVAELKELARRIAAAEILLGNGEKTPQACEVALEPQVRRSAAAAEDLPAGTVLRLSHLAWVRPSGGIAPGAEAELLGRVLARSVRVGEILTPDHLAATS